MENKLVADSSCELIPELEESLAAETVPFSMMVDGVNYIDHAGMDLAHFLTAMRQSKHVPKSACPSPDAFFAKCGQAANTFLVTISSKLSGCYNSALLAQKLAEEAYPGKRVHVFDSQSASAGEIAVALKIKECVEAHLDMDAIIEKVTAFIHEMRTFFILESLDNLIKNGRMSKLTGYAASLMSLRPIMTADAGEIRLAEKARGSVRAFSRLADMIGECRTNFSDRTLVITHCNNERQATFLHAEALKRYNFKAIHVIPTRGLSSMYANEGGVIIAF